MFFEIEKEDKSLIVARGGLEEKTSIEVNKCNAVDPDTNIVIELTNHEVLQIIEALTKAIKEDDNARKY